MTGDAPARDIASQIETIFHPRAIAVVGASANPDTPGYDYLHSLQAFGYRGRLYAVNPKGGEMLGLPVYRSLRETPGEVDYVICCIPAEHVLELVRECGERGVKALQLFTGRFSETGRPDAAGLERQVLAAAREAGVRIIGPNCMGLLYPGQGISFRADMSREAGSVGFLSQSGNLLFELTHYGAPRGLRFSKAVSYGNALDLDESDFLQYFAEDAETRVVGAYLEGLRDGRRFLAALRHAAGRKPVVVLKGGRTGAGGRAAASHTAALAGPSAVWQAAIAQAGALAVDTVEDLIDMLIAFDRLQGGARANAIRPYAGHRLGMVGAGGGPSTRSVRFAPGAAQDERPRLGMVGAGGGRSVLTADLCEELGLAVPPLPEDVERKVAERAPGLAGWVTNPVDQSILAGSGLGGGQVLEWLDESPQIDLLLANMNEAWAFGRPNADAILSRVAERFIQVAAQTRKPFAVVLGPSDYAEEERRRLVSQVRDRLAAAKVALYPSVERAVRALARFTAYWERRQA
ncbi:MAG: CoA-binding protein [Dehalococcoidia bacterium]|nr:CoA-binding protein [Dehalococcoidia bacterium]